MAWTYSDWITQATPAEKVSQLELHMQEVSDQITASVASDGKSRDPNVLQTYYAGLQSQYEYWANRSSGLVNVTKWGKR